MASAATTELLTQDGLGTMPGVLPFKAHPLYVTWAPIWRKLAHVYDGAGGFLNGTYLIAHPREWLDYTSENPVKPTRKLKNRRKLARYENIAATIVDEKRAALFKQTPQRIVGEPSAKEPAGKAEHPYLLWCDNVDGAGCSMDDFLKYAWTMAAIFGHVFLYMDRPSSEQAPRSLAEQQQPFLRLYTPLDVPDWLVDNYGELTAVKMVEPIQRTSLDDPIVSGIRYRSRYVDQQNWWIDGDTGAQGQKQPHNLGTLPVVVLYSGRKALQQVIGDSVLRDPKLFIDLYNLSSELRELLRNQTFGILNVQLGTGADAVDVNTVKAWNGDQSGTENVFFSPGAANFIQPDASNVTAYQAERQYLLRTIYRLCVVHYEADTKDAKSADALKLETQSFGQLLSSYADELEDAEYQIADLWWRATYGATVGPVRLEREGLTIRWPDEFEQATIADALKATQAALSLSLGATAEAALKQALIPQVLPDLPGDVAKKIQSEIEALPTQAEEKQQQLQSAISKGRLTNAA